MTWSMLTLIARQNGPLPEQDRKEIDAFCSDGTHLQSYKWYYCEDRHPCKPVD
jgi:hypothetical protein